MTEEEKLIEEFDDFSKCYDEVVVEHLGYRSHEIIPNLILKYLRVPNANILDLGCGTGISSSLFFKNNHSVTGVDVSPGMITHAKHRPFKKLFCQNLEAPLYLKDEEFDAAILLGVMEFIKKPSQLFERIHKVLKPAALFGVTFPTNQPGMDTGLDVKSYTEGEILALVQSTGFEILEEDNFLGYDSGDYTINYSGLILKKR